MTKTYRRWTRESTVCVATVWTIVIIIIFCAVWFDPLISLFLAVFGPAAVLYPFAARTEFCSECHHRISYDDNGCNYCRYKEEMRQRFQDAWQERRKKYKLHSLARSL